jgi:hypothetical protein
MGWLKNDILKTMYCVSALYFFAGPITSFVLYRLPSSGRYQIMLTINSRVRLKIELLWYAGAALVYFFECLLF